MKTSIDHLADAITTALDDTPAVDVLTLITGVFVGLTVELIRREGHAIDRAIKVDGGAQRDITIHAPKGKP